MTTPENSHFPWLMELNPDQRRAVTHGGGPLLIVAGAGSGKTRTLAYRVAYLIATGVDPERILLLTFTRRASEEMIKRAESIVHKGTGKINHVWGGTFHAMANRLLRVYAQAADLDPGFTVLDSSDAEDLMNVARHELDLHTKEKRFPRKSTCLAIYSRCVNGSEDMDHVLNHFFPWCAEWKESLRTLFKEYVIRKQARHVLDYDDLLLYWRQLVSDEELASRIGGRFDHILVDEYQDTNRVQSDILKNMRRTVPNITVVGDDAQSIYSFRAATIRNMLDFPKEFPGTTVVTLERNYRSVAPILETTNRVIAQAKDRFTKDLWSERTTGQRPQLVTCKDEAQQDEFIIQRVLEHYEQGIPLKKQAVLFRASHLSDSLEIELTRKNIPYHKYGGLRFLEAAHVKDLICIMRILENPRDDLAWFRILQLMDGVGPTTASRVVKHISENQYDPLSIRSFAAPPSAAEQMKALQSLLEDLLETGKDIPPAGQIHRIRVFYDPILQKVHENPTVRSKDLENLESVASTYTSRAKFLTDLQLDPPSSTSDLAGPPLKDEDWLVLSTIHSAKGCEWDVVFLIHAADGFLPSDMATGRPEDIDEERRLTYVAMTRAKDFLYITWPLRYYHKWHSMGDRHSYAQLCRFFTDEVRQTLDQFQLPGREEEAETSSLKGKLNIASRMRSMWD